MSQAGLLTYSRFMSFPFRPTKQWMQYVMKRIKEFTAAGLSGTLTPFLFTLSADRQTGHLNNDKGTPFPFFRARVFCGFYSKVFQFKNPQNNQ